MSQIPKMGRVVKNGKDRAEEFVKVKSNLYR